MTRRSVIFKFQRYQKILELLAASKVGMTQAELARILGVNRSTIHRDLANLEDKPILLRNGRYYLDPKADLIQLHLNRYEALALYLACRLLDQRLDRQNPHAAQALEKLSGALREWAGTFSKLVKQAGQAFTDQKLKRRDANFLRTFEALADGWVSNRMVGFQYQSRSKQQVTNEVVGVIHIEPYAFGMGIHLVAYPEGENSLRVYRLDRISGARVLERTFVPPPDKVLKRFFQSSWGVWVSDKEPVVVRLRFGQEVAGRVRETQWHHLQTLEERKDGSLVWSCELPDWLSILPWIRGWGADCEVLEPADLRERIREEVKRLERVYG